MAAATSMNENVPDSAIQSYSIQEVEFCNHEKRNIHLKIRSDIYKV